MKRSSRSILAALLVLLPRVAATFVGADASSIKIGPGTSGQGLPVDGVLGQAAQRRARSTRYYFNVAAAFAMLVTSGTIAGASAKDVNTSANPAAISDPKPDAAHPANIVTLLIPSSGSMMNSVLYTAAGAGAHPTLLLLHGMPGNEQNLDLAQAARRAGWNVLTMHFRGSWGSEGDYTVGNTVADTAAAMAFLRDPANAAKYGIDPKKLAIVGHSIGGYDAAAQARTDHQILGVSLIDAWSAAPPDRVPDHAATIVNFLQGTNPHSLKIASAERVADEYIHIFTQQTITTFAKDLIGIPVLIVGAEKANGGRNKVLADAIAKQDGSRLQAIVLPTDHSFSDRRIELANILLNWLDSIK